MPALVREVLEQECNTNFFVFTDASDFAWRAVFIDVKIGGSWNSSESSCHINVKEIYLFIMLFTDFLLIFLVLIPRSTQTIQQLFLL